MELSNHLSDLPPCPPGNGAPGHGKSKAKKTHVCSVCRQTFRRAEHLKRHFRRHTLERPFRCRVCLMSFPRKESHSRHQKKHHGCSPSTVPSPEIVPSLGRDEIPQSAGLPPLSPSATTNPRSRDLPVGVHRNIIGHAHPADERPLPPPSRPEPLCAPWQNNLEYDIVNASTDRGNSISLSTGSGADHHVTASDQSQQISQLLQAAHVIDAAGMQDGLREVPGFPIQAAEETGDGHFGVTRIEDGRAEVSRGLSGNGGRLQNINPYLPTNFGSISEELFAVSSFDSLYAPNIPSPYPFFTTGFENPRTTGTLAQTIPTNPGLSSLPTFRISEDAQARLRQAVQSMYGAYCGPTDWHGQLAVPGPAILDRYWDQFWAFPSKNLPFLHEASTDPNTAPVATLLAILADGAMYCGDKHIGMAFFECSRRLVSHYFDSGNTNNTTVPLWVVNTLLINSVFGIPGGDALDSRLTVRSLESLLALSARIEPYTLTENNMHSPIRTVGSWDEFIQRESFRRTRLCVLIVFCLWSTVYTDLKLTGRNTLDTLEMPCDEDLWSAKSSDEWQELAQRPGTSKVLRVRSVVESLSNTGFPYSSGLSGLCQIAGLLVYLDELRSASTMTKTELGEHLGQALTNWSKRHKELKRCFTASIAFPAAAFARLSLKVDVQTAMSLFMKTEFSRMRAILQGGELLEAAAHGMSALVPWAIAHKNQVSMVSVPCAVVVCESVISGARSAEQEIWSPIETLRMGFGLPESYDLSRPSTVWELLRKIIGSGPMTAMLSSAVQAYHDFLCNSILERPRN